MATPKVIPYFRNVLKVKPITFTRLISSSRVCLKPETQEEQLSSQQTRNKEAGSYTELVRDFLDPGKFHNAVKKEGIDFFLWSARLSSQRLLRLHNRQ